MNTECAVTPEEKAHELVIEFGKKAGTYMNELVFGIAKRSALICVDEVLEYLDDAVTIVYADGGERLKPQMYWHQVKESIKKIEFT